MATDDIDDEEILAFLLRCFNDGSEVFADASASPDGIDDDDINELLLHCCFHNGELIFPPSEFLSNSEFIELTNHLEKKLKKVFSSSLEKRKERTESVDVGFSKKMKRRTDEDGALLMANVEEDMEDFMINFLLAINDSSEQGGGGGSSVGRKSTDLPLELEGLFGFDEMHQTISTGDGDYASISMDELLQILECQSPEELRD